GGAGRGGRRGAGQRGRRAVRGGGARGARGARLLRHAHPGRSGRQSGRPGPVVGRKPPAEERGGALLVRTLPPHGRPGGVSPAGRRPKRSGPLTPGWPPYRVVRNNRTVV